jgi:hypothetical protein
VSGKPEAYRYVRWQSHNYQLIFLLFAIRPLRIALSALLLALCP